MELTYEGLRTDLNRAIEQQEKEVEEFGQYLHREFETGQMSPGEPGDRYVAQGLEHEEERLFRLRDWARGLDEREEQGLRLASEPGEDWNVEQLLDMIY